MTKLPCVVLSLILVFGITTAAQNQTAKSASSSSSANANKPKRGPVFRATADQIKQAQSILRQRNFYAGEDTGKLTADTRAGLKQYQAAEGLKVTGTLNKVTLVKMGITLTERQKTM
jgi:peptidoglycan hydrolase-like protein with peptidoglycan-binding domain